MNMFGFLHFKNPIAHGILVCRKRMHFCDMLHSRHWDCKMEFQ